MMQPPSSIPPMNLPQQFGFPAYPAAATTTSDGSSQQLYNSGGAPFEMMNQNYQQGSYPPPTPSWNPGMAPPVNKGQSFEREP
ncbi:unnamed protein product [Eruca vesicaria subsp. sativa]|uniref:Uncharacterized protein n=1 Tax=Eruca vesicaria subsp. sativa TaxID=29727 RepID=A0ABC8JSF7_ERUVS|nr:unnamed protein product [Eruca vesicaria subsp. sativa]